MQDIHCFFPIFGWSGTVFLTFWLWKLWNLFPQWNWFLFLPFPLSWSSSLSAQTLSFHMSLLPTLLLGLLTDLLSDLLLPSLYSLSWFTKYWLIDFYSPCPVHFFKRCCSGPGWGSAPGRLGGPRGLFAHASFRTDLQFFYEGNFSRDHASHVPDCWR